MSDDRLSIGIEELDSPQECPVCGKTFNTNIWEEEGGYHFRSGGATNYRCPTNGCNGKVTVYI